MKTIEFKPEIPYTSRFSLIKVDDWINSRFLRHGAPAQDMGFHFLREDIDSNDLGSDIFNQGFRQTLFVLKEPGSDTHHCPAPLVTLAQKAACHQYSVSPFARDKVGVLTLRAQTLSARADLIASEWHAHSFLDENYSKLRVKSRLRKGLSVFAPEGQKADLTGAMNKVHPGLLINEYIWSNIEPGFVQSKYADNLRFAFNRNAIIPENIQDIPHRRVGTMNLTFITSQVFHKAPDNADISPENHGRERFFIDIMYLPTRDMASKIPSRPVPPIMPRP